MSPDVIGMIIALFAFTLTVLGGVAGMLARQTKNLEGQFNQRFDRIDGRMDRFDGRMDRFDGRMERLENEVVEIKIAVARLEGPQRRLQQL